jgi:hypothetical protein
MTSEVNFFSTMIGRVSPVLKGGGRGEYFRAQKDGREGVFSAQDFFQDAEKFLPAIFSHPGTAPGAP